MASKKTRKEKKQQIKRFLAQTPQEDYDKAIGKFFRTYESSLQEPLAVKKTTKTTDRSTSVAAPVSTSPPTSVITSVAAPIATSAKSSVVRVTRQKKSGTKKEPHRFEYLDATHSASEQNVYSILYRESRNMEYGEIRVRVSEITKKTGLSDKTVRTALHNLENKLSISILERSKSPYGRLYRVHEPKGVLEKRKMVGLRIDPVTKHIKSTYASSEAGTSYKTTRPQTTSVTTPVAPSVTTPVDSAAHTSVNTGEGTSANPTDVTPVNITDVRATTLLINKNNKSKYSYTNKTSSKSSTTSKHKQNIDDEEVVFNHKKFVVQLYEKYSGNKWKPSDDKVYEEIKGVLPDVIEAAIIASVLRCKTKINSLAYCEGAVKEYDEFLPPGYLGYLRDKWNDTSGQ